MQNKPDYDDMIASLDALLSAPFDDQEFRRLSAAINKFSNQYSHPAFMTEIGIATRRLQDAMKFKNADKRLASIREAENTLRYRLRGILNDIAEPR